MTNMPACRTAEIVSGYCNASARGLGKLAAFMANKGTFDGKSIMSEDTWQEAHSDPVMKPELEGGWITNYTKGGYNLYNAVKRDDPSLPRNIYTGEGTGGWGLGRSAQRAPSSTRSRPSALRRRQPSAGHVARPGVGPDGARDRGARRHPGAS